MRPTFLILVLALAATPALAADAPDVAEPFRDAIAYAQKRCVKVYGGGAGREHGYATGLVVSPDGLILTAQGIYLSEERVRVVLPDGSRHNAEVLRRSEPLQAALLKIDGYLVTFIGDMYRDNEYHCLSAELAGELARIPGLVWKANLVWYDVSKRLHLYGYQYAYIPSLIHQNILVFRREA